MMMNELSNVENYSLLNKRWVSNIRFSDYSKFVHLFFLSWACFLCPSIMLIGLKNNFFWLVFKLVCSDCFSDPYSVQKTSYTRKYLFELSCLFLFAWNLVSSNLLCSDWFNKLWRLTFCWWSPCRGNDVLDFLYISTSLR